MNSRQARVTLILVVLVAAILTILLAVLAHFAHTGYSMPFDGFLLSASLTTWRILGVMAFIFAVIVMLIVGAKPQLLFRVQDITDRTLKPQLHIRCRNCGVVERMEDVGERPMKHFCPKCGNVGEYAGPESGEKDFIYTRIEMKLGCTRCNTTFRIPEPLVRPLFTECPNCHAKGVLKNKQRPKDAQELPLRCMSCGHGFHVYAIKGRWADRFPCPACGTDNPLPQGAPAPAPAPA